MPDISQITLPSGSTYDIKDATAREDIEELRNSISGGVRFVGETTTEITDESTTKPITVNESSYDQIKGDIVVYNDFEFIWDGDKWIEFGNMGVFGLLAYKDSASGTYTPSGNISRPSFTGDTLTSTGRHRPTGTISNQTFTGTKATLQMTGTPDGTISISQGVGDANYTPEGSVSAPTLSISTSDSSIQTIDSVGTLPEFSATVSNENLTLGFTQGSLPTKNSALTVLTSIDSATASAPTFTGTGAVLEASFTGATSTFIMEYTPQGSVSKGTFTGTEVDISVSGTPSGAVSIPTFTGTQATITVS